MESSAMRYTPAILARLTHSYAAYELSERLVSEAGTYGDEYGRGAFLTEEASTIVSEAMALLEAAVVADRLRGASWLAVADALEVPAEDAEAQFAAAERRFRDALLFPHAIQRTEVSDTRWRPTRSKSLSGSGASSTPGSSSIVAARDRIATSRSR